MKFDATFLCSKLARRIFGLFVLCAFLPVVILAILSFGHVTKQLNEQNHRRIQGEAKSVGMAIFERLLFLDREIRAVAYDFNGSIDTATHALTERFGERLRQRFKGSKPRRFMWTHGNKEYLASYWTIFLKARFFVPKWTVVLSQAKADAAAPLADFKKIFPLVVLVSLGMVLLLSSIQIRRSLVPLEKLKEGTDRIAMKDFDSQVVVTSGDEFEELAVSFNAMSNRLGKQFNTFS